MHFSTIFVSLAAGLVSASTTNTPKTSLTSSSETSSSTSADNFTTVSAGETPITTTVAVWTETFSASTTTLAAVTETYKGWNKTMTHSDGSVMTKVYHPGTVTHKPETKSRSAYTTTAPMSTATIEPHTKKVLHKSSDAEIVLPSRDLAGWMLLSLVSFV